MRLQVVRYENSEGKKTFRKKTFRHGSWENRGLDGGDLAYPLYWTELAKDRPVYVVEGEKDADSLRDLGFQATTGEGGAHAVAKTDWSVLTGYEIVAIRDCDKPGRDWLTALSGAIDC